MFSMDEGKRIIMSLPLTLYYYYKDVESNQFEGDFTSSIRIISLPYQKKEATGTVFKKKKKKGGDPCYPVKN